jgi:hypothetical protein
MARVVFAGLLGYIVIGILIFAADHVIPRGPDYYPIVLVADTAFTLAGGWLCGRLSRGDGRAAWGLILMGEVMGVASTVYLWRTAPHYYSIYLLVMYPPAVWFGANRLVRPHPDAAAQSDVAQTHSLPGK